MADIRINDLPAKTTLSDTDAFAVDGANETARITFSDLTNQIIKKDFEFAAGTKTIEDAINETESVLTSSTCITVADLKTQCEQQLGLHQGKLFKIPVGSNLITELFGDAFPAAVDAASVYAFRRELNVLEYIATCDYAGAIGIGSILSTGLVANKRVFFSRAEIKTVARTTNLSWTLNKGSYLIFVTSSTTSDADVGVYFAFSTDGTDAVVKAIKDLSNLIISSDGNKAVFTKNGSFDARFLIQRLY